MTLTGSMTYRNVRGIYPPYWVWTEFTPLLILQTTMGNSAHALWESLQLSGIGCGHLFGVVGFFSFARSFSASNVPSAGRESSPGAVGHYRGRRLN